MKNLLANTPVLPNIVPMLKVLDVHPTASNGDVGNDNLHQNCPTTAPLRRTETFQYKGRLRRIFTRSADRNAPWYYYLERGCKRYKTSLRTSSVPAAIAQAKLLIDAAEQNKLAQVRALLANRPDAAKQYCSVEDYLARYENLATGENTAQSRHRAVGAFRRLMAAMPTPPARMDQLAPMFKAARAGANARVEACPDNAKKISAKISFNSELANAASVLTEMAVFGLQEDLELPDFTELRSLIKFVRFSDAKKTAAQYNPPPAAVLEATLAAWPSLPRNEFLAVGLALCCGARVGEIRDYAHWDWFEVHHGRLWVDARTGDFKDGTSLFRVQVLDPFYSMMVEHVQKEGWFREGLIIQGNRSEFDRGISSWMKNLGWKTRLHLHTLRAWAGSLVYMEYGADAAKKFCRHAKEQTTKDHYGWMREEWHTQDTAVLVAGKRVEWVANQQTSNIQNYEI